MKINEWLAVIAVMIVVAIIVSVITISMTGKVINVNPAATPIPNYTQQIYTKAEIDKQIDSLSNRFSCNLEILGFKDGCSGLSSAVKSKIKELQNTTWRVVLVEGEKVYRGEYLVLPGYISYGRVVPGYVLQVWTIINQTSGYSNDDVVFKDMISGDLYYTIITQEGYGPVNIGGHIYDMKYYGRSSISSDERYVTLDFPETKGSIKMVFCC